MKRVISLLSNTKIFVFTISWMMVLVVLGTLAQRDMGLFAAQQKYFSSWIAWIGFIPTPGGRITMLLMFVNMISFMFKPYLWSLKKIGIIITHGGAILLLIGGGLTAYFSAEGSMIIEEGESVNYVIDSHHKELAIINTSPSEYDQITSISDNQLFSDNTIQSEHVPFKIEVLEYYKNCKPHKRAVPVGIEYKGLAKNYALIQFDDEKEDNRNQSGVTIQITGVNEATDGIYSLFIGQSVPQHIQVGDEKYSLVLRRQRTYLPFELELIDFKKVLHPGTGMAKSFSSDINLIEDEISRNVLIEMNEPLRHRGYTFYQSSFSEAPDKDTTILSAVKNYGRLFPYISSLIMSLGLLLHMLVKLPKLLRTKSGRVSQ